MMKNNRVTAWSSVLAVAVALAGTPLGLAGCTAAAANPSSPASSGSPSSPSSPSSSGLRGQSVTELKARLTGYAFSSPAGRRSGPVSVTLGDASAARIDQLVNGLQADTGPGCADNAELYQIDFSTVAGVKRDFDVAGYQCGGLVSVTSDGKTVNRIDRNCTLLSAVRRLLPAAATATRRNITPCVS
jgi:hypothetical protein